MSIHNIIMYCSGCEIELKQIFINYNKKIDQNFLKKGNLQTQHNLPAMGAHKLCKGGRRGAVQEEQQGSCLGEHNTHRKECCLLDKRRDYVEVYCLPFDFYFTFPSVFSY